MTNVWSRSSKAKLDSCHPELREIMDAVLKVMDITVIFGARSTEDQKKAFASGNSKLNGVTVFSKHQVGGNTGRTLADAIDIAPWPIPKNWGGPGPDRLWNKDEMKSIAQFYYLAGLVKGIAASKGIKIRWGGDWDGDNDFHDQTFEDLGHFERIG